MRIRGRHGEVLASLQASTPSSKKTESGGQPPTPSELLEQLPAAIYLTDTAGRITYFNRAAEDLWGVRPTLGESEWCGSWRLYWPDGRRMPHPDCPMAEAIRKRAPIRGVEAQAERPDGTRVPFLAYPTPLHDEDGTFIGAINMLVDITERKRFSELDQFFAAIVNNSDDAIVCKNLDGIINTWNPGAARLFGYAPEEVIGRPITILIPTDHLDEEPQILEKIRRGEHVDHYETVRRRKDGSLVDISLSVSPVRNSEGRVVGASKIARDISDRKRAQEQQRLLLREMQHRVQNLFSIAAGLVSLSARNAATPQDMAAALHSRLSALARTQDLTRPGLVERDSSEAGQTTLEALLQTVFAPYSEDVRRVILKGPDVSISGSAVTNFALIFNEYATNAAKYGALSTPSGLVTVSWEVRDSDLFMLNWIEQGGPPVLSPPQRAGFGSTLADRITRGQLRGDVSYDWQSDGLCVRLEIPLAGLTY